MKISKSPLDLNSALFHSLGGLFVLTFFITIRNKEFSDLAYYSSALVFGIIAIFQFYTLYIMTSFSRPKKRFIFNQKENYNEIFLAIVLSIGPMIILILLRIYAPNATDWILGAVTAIGALGLIYLLKAGKQKSYEQSEPLVQLVGYKKRISLIQRFFRVDFEKEEIQKLVVDHSRKTVTITSDNERVFNLSQHTYTELLAMKEYYSRVRLE